MKRFLYILFVLLSISACEKYNDDPSKRGYTPDAIDDNSWTVNIMDNDSLLAGMNPKDSTFMGTLVYGFMSKYAGYDMITDNGSLSPKHDQDVLIRAVDENHINLGIRSCCLIADDGTRFDLGNVILENIELQKSGDKIVFAKNLQTDSNISVEGELDGNCLSIIFNTEIAARSTRFCFLSTEAYKRDYPQVENGDFETWTVDGDNLPDSWNSFQTATGDYASMYYVSKNRQVERSTDTRPGSRGKSSCHIWANKLIELIVPGHLTTGTLHLGSMIAAKENNYTLSAAGSASPFTSKPDSIAFWVKFIPASDTIIYKTARFTACIHDGNDYVLYNDDANDNASNKLHLVAKASALIDTKDGDWQRISVPFEYTSNTNAQYILIDISTNSVPGKGTFKDDLYIDDIETIYRTAK